MTATDVHDDTVRFRGAQELWQEGNVEATSVLLNEILERDSGHVEAAMLLAEVLQSQGRLDAASQVTASLCRHLSWQADVTLRCAQFMQRCQRHHSAARLCDEAFASGKVSADLRALAGNIAREIGDFEAARAHYLAALKTGVNLDRWFVLGALANTQRYDTSAHPDFARFTTHFHDRQYSLLARAATGFGLAKAYDDIGAYAVAARTLREANLLARQAQPWCRKSWRQWIDARKQSRFVDMDLSTPTDFAPIFIVGLPRSGTTLAAVQLGRHADVCDRGEVPLIGFIAERLLAGNHLHDVGALHEAAALYRSHIRQDDAAARWYVDKDPNNFRYLDMIAALFPQARVIHCRRDRRDTALSIWSQCFAHANYGFANDFDDIAAFMAGHDDLMQHWIGEGLSTYTLDYEDMIAAPEATLEKLRAFIGIPADDARAAAHSLAAPINSASVWQARQPIYQSSVGRWRTYSEFLPELVRF